MHSVRRGLGCSDGVLGVSFSSVRSTWLLCCSPSGLSVLSLVRLVVFVESESGYLAGCKTLGISLSLSLALRRVVESVGATGS